MFTHDGFQNRCFKPLSHPLLTEAGLEPAPLPYESKILPIKLFRLKKRMGFEPMLA